MSLNVVLVPGAPALVPELAGAAARDGADGVAAAVDLLVRARENVRVNARENAREGSAGPGAPRSDGVCVWGSDAAGRRVGDVRADLRRWGVPVPVGRPDAIGIADSAMPDAALLGWWFLDRAGVTGPRTFVGVSGDRTPDGPAGDLVVVVADGPASLTPRAPVPEDPRGVGLDADLARWLREGGDLPDPGPEVADAIGWWSRPTWLALAGLTGGAPAAESTAWAPFGVGYHCARWSLPRAEGER